MSGKSQSGVGFPQAFASIKLAGVGAVLTLGIAMWAVTSTAASATAPSETPTEYQVKAAFLYNFAKFVEWPDQPNPSVQLCTVGDDPFGNILEETVKGKTLNGHPIAVKRFKAGENARGCQIAFIGVPERETRPVLDMLQGASTLTVGESPNFAKEGGIINFVLEGNKVRFEINVAAAQQARLKISSKLLSLARIVGN